MSMVVTLKVMPSGVDVDLQALTSKVLGVIKELYPKTETRVEEQPIAFGLKALIIKFVMPETESTDAVEEKVRSIENIESAEVIDLRRAVG
ncbi:elongation factor 1-beta [Candidatus Woesearchaeota archaeon]|nr:elongation factor 1-beta [Candidatus Woesearchaeota archaeon]